MKKIIAIIMISVICLVLMCGCGDDGKKSSLLDETLVPIETSTQQEEPESEESYEDLISKYVDLELYTLVDSSEDYASYQAKEENEYNISKDFIVDGKSFSVGMAYDDIIDAGFTPVDDISSDKMEPGAGEGVTFVTHAGKEIWFTLENNSDTEIMTTECVLGGLTIEYAYDIDFSIDGITAQTDVKDYIDSKGTPNNVSYDYYAEIDKEYITFSYNGNGEDGGWLFVTVDTEGNIYRIETWFI